MRTRKPISGRRLSDEDLINLIREVRDKIDEVDEATMLIQQELMRRADGGDP